MTRQVVFGTGQVGRPLIERLVAAGHDVVGVNRRGVGAVPGASIVAADATDASTTRAVVDGAASVYFCLNAAHYDRWPQEFPPLQRGVLAAVEATGARLVVLDNLYAYGPTHGADLVETMPAHPRSAKAATRAAMTAELLAAHAAGRVEVAIGRASDYFGPGVTSSALGETVFGHALSGRAAQVMGRPDRLHSYSYVPDVAEALAILGTRPDTTGRIWHLPVAPARTTREVVEIAYRAAGRRCRLVAVGRTALTLAGLVRPALREYGHTLYQFTERWVVDDSRFRAAFGVGATPLDEAVAATVSWYVQRLAAAGVPTHVDGAADTGQV